MKITEVDATIPAFIITERQKEFIERRWKAKWIPIVICRGDDMVERRKRYDDAMRNCLIAGVHGKTIAAKDFDSPFIHPKYLKKFVAQHMTKIQKQKDRNNANGKRAYRKQSTDGRGSETDPAQGL